MNEKELLEWRRKDNTRIRQVIHEYRTENADKVQEADKVRLQSLSERLVKISVQQRQYKRSDANYWYLSKIRNAVHDAIRKTIYTMQQKNTNDVAGQVTSAMIEHAKNYPMENIIEFDRGWACCLWHDDHKPSAKLLPDNKIRCYVCNENHDAIDAYQKVHGVEFLEAVRKMQ